MRVDIRYTPTSAFETFPWPRPSEQQREEIGSLARAHLATLHRQLDEAVARAYGWPKSAAHDPAEANRRLLDLNRRILAGEVEYDPF